MYLVINLKALIYVCCMRQLSSVSGVVEGREVWDEWEGVAPEGNEALSATRQTRLLSRPKDSSNEKTHNILQLRSTCKNQTN